MRPGIREAGPPPAGAVAGAPAGRRVRVVEAAPAKVNLGLCVLGRRADGYHELDTVMAAIGLADELELAEAPDLPEGHVSVEVGGPEAGALERSGVPLQESVDAVRPGPPPRNLVLRAAAELVRWVADGGAWPAGWARRGPPFDGASGAAQGPVGVRMRLVKRIPVGAGLGGGSADAAAALRGLNRLWGLGLGPPALEAVAARVGADVAFCVRGGLQRARGAGESLEALPCRLRAACVVVAPHTPVATAEAYRLWDELHPGAGAGGACGRAAARGCPEMDRLVAALSRGRLEEVAGLLRNDLAEAACRLSPATARVLELFSEVGVRGAVAGSGSAAFALASPEQAPALARAMARRLAREGVAAGVFTAPLPVIP